MYDLPNGFKLVTDLNFLGKKISYIAWSPDGCVLAIALSDGSLHFWNAESCISRGLLVTQGSQITYLAWSNDGCFIAAATTEQTIYVWDFLNCTLRQVIHTCAENILTIAWSPNDSHINSALIFSTYPYAKLFIQCHDVSSGNKLHSYSKDNWDQAFPATSQDGKILALALKDGRIEIWSISDLNLIAVVAERYCEVCSVEFSSDRKTLALALDDGGIHLWKPNLVCCKPTGLYKHTEIVYSLSFNHDGRVLASKSIDNTIILWRHDTLDVAAILREPTFKEVALAFHPKLDRLVTSARKDTSLLIWELNLDILLQPVQVPDTISRLFDELKNILSAIKAMSDEPTRVIHTQRYFEKIDTYIENNHPIDLDVKHALDDLKQVVADLQQKYPQATEEQATAIIQAEFQEIETTRLDRWQNFLTLKRLCNGLKKGSLKIGEHFAEETAWGKGVIGFLEGVTDEAE